MDENRMIIALGTDHAGFHYKEAIKKHFADRGVEVVDFGTSTPDRCDYPDFVHPAAAAVATGQCTHGIVLGGSGNGEAIVANKVKGIRCAVVHSEETAVWAKSHNDANMIAIGERTITVEQALRYVDIWLGTDFEGGRHAIRVDKINALDENRG